MAPFDRPHFSFYWRFIVTMALVSFPKLSEIFVKNRDFSYLLHLMTPLGGGAFSMEKIRMAWLPDSGKSLVICSAVSTQYRRVTDGRTDIGRTDILRQQSTR